LLHGSVINAIYRSVQDEATMASRRTRSISPQATITQDGCLVLAGNAHVTVVVW